MKKTNNITLKEVFEKVVALSTRIEFIDKSNNKTISRFRYYSLTALFGILVILILEFLILLKI